MLIQQQQFSHTGLTPMPNDDGSLSYRLSFVFVLSNAAREFLFDSVKQALIRDTTLPKLRIESIFVPAKVLRHFFFHYHYRITWVLRYSPLDSVGDLFAEHDDF